MPAYQVAVCAPIQASSGQVYKLLADYQTGHKMILPKSYFVSLEVEKGGYGEGTVIRFQMRVLGKVHTLRAAITEPVPGQVLVETSLDPNGPVTTFEVTPTPMGGHCKVTISTKGQTQTGGLLGWVERFYTVGLLKKIYWQELENLAGVAARG